MIFLLQVSWQDFFSGFGIGIVFKYGGTTGGTDIIARILDLKLGIPVGKSLLGLDAFCFDNLPHLPRH